MLYILFMFFFFNQKTAYEMRISDWSSDVCSSDLRAGERRAKVGVMAGKGAHRLLDRVLDELTTGGRVSGEPAPVVVRLLPLGPLARTYGDRTLAEIGRASWRERVCQYVLI